MKRMAIGLAVLGALAAAAPAHAGFGTIAAEDDFFDPSTTIEAGLSGAQFSWEWGDTITNDHNVRQDTKLFYSGEATDSTTESFGPIELPAGKYHYYCEVHGDASGGMDGSMNITPTVASQVDDYVPITWALDSGIRVGDQWDVRYRVNSGKWKSWLKNTKKLEGKFGRNDKPVAFNPNKFYEVAVKTEKASNTKRHSGFSPPEGFGD